MNDELFDQDIPLDELLPQPLRQRLHGALAALLGEPFCLLDAQGAALPGETRLAGERIPLVLELEPVGYLETACRDKDRQLAAGRLLELQLGAAARYKMASRLHVESVRADYEALQIKHQALLQSEARFRALSESLERRVKEQVGTIEEAQRQLYQAEKMASVGQLAAGVAHEINNPIGFIRSNLNSARGYVQKLAALAPAVKAGDAARLSEVWQKGQTDALLEDFAELLQESIAGADRVARIVADLKSFSSVDRVGTESVDLNDCIRTVGNMAGTRMAGHGQLELELGALPMLDCNVGHINQALMNLLLNAIAAVGEDGRIVMRSKAVGREIVISVEDNGAGIPLDVLPRIFDPFYTTRDVGQGTGLGLTVCRDIITAHGGHIEVESEPGKGTAFVIHLPVAARR